MRVVLDTNVVVSAHLVNEGPSAKILKLAFIRSIHMCVSRPLLEEYRRKLSEPRFHLSFGTVRQTLARIRAVGNLVAPTQHLRLSDDETDNRFYECAAKAKAHYIITGNIAHFPRPYKFTRIVTPRQFLEIWSQS